MENKKYEIIVGQLNSIFVRTNLGKEMKNSYDYIVDILEDEKYKLCIKVLNKIDNTGIKHTLEIKSLFDTRKHIFELDDKQKASLQHYGDKNPFKKGKYLISIKPKQKVEEDENELKKEIEITNKDEEVEFLLTSKCFENQTMTYPVAGYSSFTKGGFDFKDDWKVDGGQFTTTNNEKKYALHTGIDLKGAEGTEVYAIYDGVVKAYYSAGSGWGMALTIEHTCPCEGKYTSNYTHIKSTLKSGDNVKKGDYIGNLEDIDLPHLHFSIRKGDYSNISNRGALPSETVSKDDTKWNVTDKPVMDTSNFLNPNNFEYEFKGNIQ